MNIGLSIGLVIGPFIDNTGTILGEGAGDMLNIIILVCFLACLRIIRL